MDAIFIIFCLIFFSAIIMKLWEIVHPIFEYITKPIFRRRYEKIKHKRWLEDDEPKYRNNKSINGYPIDWRERKLYIMNQSNNKCSSCGLILGDNLLHAHIHHKIPLSKGGDHSFGNLELLCKACHFDKHPNLRKAVERRDLFIKLGLLDPFGNVNGKLVKRSTYR